MEARRDFTLDELEFCNCYRFERIMGLPSEGEGACGCALVVVVGNV